MHLVYSKRVEQVDIMHDIVVERIHRRIVARFAKSGMVGMDDAEFVRPGLGEFIAVKGARAMQEEQRLAFAGGIKNRIDAVDLQRLFLEVDHRFLPLHSAARCTGWLPRTRGMTSSAMSCRFFITFQCGMSPSAPWML